MEAEKILHIYIGDFGIKTTKLKLKKIQFYMILRGI